MSASRAEVPYMSTFSLLRQGKWWRDADKTVHRVRDMELSHQINLLRWIERNGERLRDAEWADIMLSFPEDPSDGVWMAMQQIEAELDAEADLPIDEWLSKLKLVRRLRREIAKKISPGATLASPLPKG